MADVTVHHPPATDHPTSVTTVPFEPIVGAHLEHTAEPQRTRWAFAAFDAAAAWTTSWLDYTTSVLERRSTPLGMLEDARRFFSTAAARPLPSWSTPFTVAREWPSTRLLDFSTEAGLDVVPTLILPPQAGHASTIVDYTPEQSQVRTALGQGLTRLFVLEWLGATQATKGTTIEDYVAILDETVELLGGRVNLVGDCQGGWLATIYAALRPEAVTSLSIGGAPIDFQAGDGAIHDWILAQKDTKDPMWLYRSLVAANGGVHKGEFQVQGFKMLEPAGEANRLADLWANIADEEYVERYLDFTAWFEHPQDMAGALYLWTVEHLFVNNELIAGTLVVSGEKVDLGRITAPVFLLAGSNDHITPPAQVWALAEHVSTPKESIHSQMVEAGHLGLFMGRRALNEHWTPLFAAVKETVGAGVPAPTEEVASVVEAPVVEAPVVAAPVVEAPVVEVAPVETKPAETKPAAPARTRRPAAKKSTPAKRTTAPRATKTTTPAPAVQAPAPAVQAPAPAVQTPDRKAAPARKPTAAKRTTAPRATKAATTPTSTVEAAPAPQVEAPTKKAARAKRTTASRAAATPAGTAAPTAPTSEG